MNAKLHITCWPHPLHADAFISRAEHVRRACAGYVSPGVCSRARAGAGSYNVASCMQEQRFCRVGIQQIGGAHRKKSRQSSSKMTQ